MSTCAKSLISYSGLWTKGNIAKDPVLSAYKQAHPGGKSPLSGDVVPVDTCQGSCLGERNASARSGCDRSYALQDTNR